jgi:hypothetical protein
VKHTAGYNVLDTNYLATTGQTLEKGHLVEEEGDRNKMNIKVDLRKTDLEVFGTGSRL